MKQRRSPFFLIFYPLAVVFFIAFTLGPILWSFVISITPQSEILASTTRLLPVHPSLKNYAKLILDENQQGLLFRRGLVNSLKAVVLALAAGIPLTILCAYPLARLKFRGAKIIRNVLLFTMAIPVFATIIPLYKLFADFQLLDNLAALVLVYITSFLPLTSWLLISHFETLPGELEEAAAIDGCSKFQTLIRIILPVSLPAILAAALIIFLAIWNQFQIPLILAPSSATKPIAVTVSEFVTKNALDYGMMNAGGILALIPPALVAVIFRKFLIKGITDGSTKG